MPVYHSGHLSKTDRPFYNYPLRPQTKDLTVPLAPRNLIITSPYNTAKQDLRWDNPKIIPENSGLCIRGCNVYRSFDSPYGPYQKLNTLPVTTLFYRDETEEKLIVSENATATLRYELEPDGRWLVYSQNKPIVIPGSNGQATLNIKDVKVEIDNGDGYFLEVPAYKVNGIIGEIQLISTPIYNYDLQQVLPPRLPVPPNGRVRISYTYLKNHVLTVLSQRIYYKVTTVAFNPSNPSVLLETPLDEISDRSAFDIEMIDYIWREALLRNRWILEQGGERVKIFIRKWAGEVCESHQQNYGQSYNDCHSCFPAGTPVRTEMGWKNIESIGVGERVLTSEGSYQKVTKLFRKEFEGNLRVIGSSISTNPILTTPDHPILVLRGSHKNIDRSGSQGHKNPLCGPLCEKFIENGDGLRLDRPDVRLLPSGRWWARVQLEGHRGEGRKSLGTFVTREEAVEAIQKYRKDNFKPGHLLDWDQARNIKRGDWVVSRWNKDIQDIFEISIPQEYLNNKYGPRQKGDPNFKVDEEFLWVLGLYIAEGSSGSRCISFSLHQDEIEYSNRVIKFFESHNYGVRRRPCKNSKGIQVIVNSFALSQWFPVWVGTKCYNKKIPNEFMNLPSNKIWAVIEGIYAGDNGEINEIVQTSEILAMQLVELLHRVGEQPLVRKQVSQVLTPKGNKRRVAYGVNWKKTDFDHKHRKKRWLFKGNLLAKVKSVEDKPFSGAVYNLEVEGDHTYIVNNVVVHNCYGTNIVGGYDGPYDMLIAPPETEKMIELADMGLHIRYDWATWGGNYPLLNPRDIIVRQNNERYVIGPVNPQGSRGAIYQQHFTMSYIDQGDIRYQIPITGGETTVPASYDQYRETAPTDASPVINEKPEIPQERIIRGRTVVFENIMYALLGSIVGVNALFCMISNIGSII